MILALRHPGVFARGFEPRGMGDFSLAKTITSAAGTGVSTGMSTGSIAAGAGASALAVIAPFTGPAAPFIAAAAALVGPIAHLFSGCGDPCRIATYYADTGAKAAQGVMDWYFGQNPRTHSMQQQALQMLTDIGNWQAQGWSDPKLGDVGKQYYDQRVKQPQNQCNASSPHAPAGACLFWNAFCCAILEDPMAVPDPTPVETAATALGLPASVNPNLLFIAAGLAAAAVAL